MIPTTSAMPTPYSAPRLPVRNANGRAINAMTTLMNGHDVFSYNLTVNSSAA